MVSGHSHRSCGIFHDWVHWLQELMDSEVFSGPVVLAIELDPCDCLEALFNLMAVGGGGGTV